MNKKEKCEFILTELEKLYPKPPIPLEHTDTFTLLIAVLLSARNTDKKVNEVTPQLFSKADTAQSMALIPESEIKECIKTIGLSNTKAKNIKKLSQILVEKYNGEVPREMDLLEELPGVGHKTASVVLCQAFETPAFPVDTHIHRMMQRWQISDGKSVVKTEEDAKKFFPKEKWIKLHLQIIYYAREYSPARGWNIDKDYLTKTILSK